MKIALLTMSFLGMLSLDAMHKVEIAKHRESVVDAERVAQRNAAVKKIADALLQSGAGEQLRAAVSRQVELAAGNAELVEQGLGLFFTAWSDALHGKTSFIMAEMRHEAELGKYDKMKLHIAGVMQTVLQQFSTSHELLLNAPEFDEIIRCIQSNLCEDSAAQAYACLAVVEKSQHTGCGKLWYYRNRLAAAAAVCLLPIAYMVVYA